MTGRLDEIAARADAASPGPWPRGGSLWVGRACDAEFVTHAREDIPWLIERLRDARAEVKQTGYEVQVARRHANRLEAELADARAEIETQDRRISELCDRLHEARSEATSWRDERNAMEAELADARAEIRDIQRKRVSETALAYHDRDEARAEVERRVDALAAEWAKVERIEALCDHAERARAFGAHNETPKVRTSMLRAALTEDKQS